MSKNLIPEIAKLLGVEIGEKFKLHPVGCDKRSDKYYDFHVALHEQVGVISCRKKGVEMPQPDFLYGLIMGYYEIVKLSWEPKKHDLFYYPFVVESRVACSFWEDYNTFHLTLKALGMVYRTQEEAEANLSKDYERLTGKPLSSR